MTANPAYINSKTLPTYLPIPQVCASAFKWFNGVGTAKALDLFSNGVPPTFAMKSPLTGKVKLFDYFLEGAIENEYWDGEYSKFTTSCGLVAIIWN